MKTWTGDDWRHTQQAVDPNAFCKPSSVGAPLKHFNDRGDHREWIIQQPGFLKDVEEWVTANVMPQSIADEIRQSAEAYGVRYESAKTDIMGQSSLRQMLSACLGS